MEKSELPCWAALAIIAGLAFVGVFVWQFPKSSSDWAAWVQAIGSIAAIGVAIWVPYKQREDQRNDERLQRSRNRMERLCIADKAIGVVIDSVTTFAVSYKDWGDVSAPEFEANIQPLVHIQKIISEIDDPHLLGLDVTLLLREASLEVADVHKRLSMNGSQSLREAIERVMNMFQPEDLLERLRSIQQEIRRKISVEASD